MANETKALLAIGAVTSCYSDFARSWYQIGHIVNRSRHGRYLSQRYAAKLGTAASRTSTLTTWSL